MKKVIVNNEEIYIDDSKLEVSETGVLDEENDELEKTQEVDYIDDLNDTLTDLWSDKE